MYNIEFSDEAEIDLDESYEYYYDDSPKVADFFFQRISLSLEAIRSNPLLSPLVYKTIRKFVVKKFPFIIYYQIKETTIRVIAIFHTSRNPQIWNERLK